jgi:hypothetical protein
MSAETYQRADCMTRQVSTNIDYISIMPAAVNTSLGYTAIYGGARIVPKDLMFAANIHAGCLAAPRHSPGPLGACGCAEASCTRSLPRCGSPASK